MTASKFIFPVLVGWLLVYLDSSSPVAYTDAPMQPYDGNTEYATVDSPAGLLVEISYSRYQFVANEAEISVACKDALKAMVPAVADRKGRKVAPLDERRMQFSLGRNGLTGITSCRAFGVAKYEGLNMGRQIEESGDVHRS